MTLVLLGVISAKGRNKAEEKNRQSGRQGAEATQLESAPGEYFSWRRQDVQRPCGGERRGLRQRQPERWGKPAAALHSG